VGSQRTNGQRYYSLSLAAGYQYVHGWEKVIEPWSRIDGTDFSEHAVKLPDGLADKMAGLFVKTNAGNKLRNKGSPGKAARIVVCSADI